jgi:glycosyltransferase involved in cell wall biosynthesis
VVVIENGCDLGRFDPDRPLPSDLRSRLGFGEDDPVLMVIGRLEPQKGHAILIEALPEIRRSFPRVRLLCLGEGGLKPQLEAQARRLGLEDAVRFLGRQPRIEEWLPLADLTVLPSFYEGLPLVALESLAAGRAVVATAVDGTPEVVVDGVTGLTVPPGEPVPLARAVCELLGDPEKRQAMALRGRDWVARRFSEERQIRETAVFYVRAWELSRRRRAAFPAAAERVGGDVTGGEDRARGAVQP